MAEHNKIRVIITNKQKTVKINLENNKLRLMATTDKLTGTFTRKYYESRFEQLINNMKSINYILKSVYGTHQKPQ